MTSTSTSPPRIVFSTNLRAARKAAGFSQAMLAYRMGSGDKMLVSNWERGINRPTDEHLMQLVVILGRDLGWFYTDHTRKP